MSREAKAVFSPGPMDTRTSSYLVRAQGNVKNADAMFALMSQKQTPFLILS